MTKKISRPLQRGNFVSDRRFDTYITPDCNILEPLDDDELNNLKTELDNFDDLSDTDPTFGPEQTGVLDVLDEGDKDDAHKKTDVFQTVVPEAEPKQNPKRRGRKKKVSSAAANEIDDNAMENIKCKIFSAGDT